MAIPGIPIDAEFWYVWREHGPVKPPVRLNLWSKTRDGDRPDEFPTDKEILKAIWRDASALTSGLPSDLGKWTVIPRKADRDRQRPREVFAALKESGVPVFAVRFMWRPGDGPSPVEGDSIRGGFPMTVYDQMGAPVGDLWIRDGWEW